MAGGMGERMRASGVEVPKPLVRVGGATLLEHNVRLLLLRGLRHIVVSVSAGPVGEQVQRFCQERLQRLVTAADGHLGLLVESRPLGNIGCAGRLAAQASTVVVVYSDNITVLDLADVLVSHATSGADLTLACHEHEFRIPYGRLDLDGDRVLGYTEKPTLSVPVASAISVLGKRALQTLPGDQPTGLAQLTRALIADGGYVAVYRHQAPWVDVNDAASLPAAENLIARHRSRLGW